jgi:hypothetical protein
MTWIVFILAGVVGGIVGAILVEIVIALWDLWRRVGP